MKASLRHIALPTAFLLLSFLFFSALIACAGFFFGVVIGPLTAPAALMAAVLTGRLAGMGWSLLGRACVTAVLIIVASAALNVFVYDTFFDGAGYHYNTVVSLAHGWNPLRELPPDGGLWAMHYAKFLEIDQAVVLSLTGNLQSVKCVNMIFALAALLIFHNAFGDCFPAITPRRRLLITLVAAANPVAIRQIFSSYNDYAVWFETLLAVSAFLMVWHGSRRRTALLVLGMTVAIAVNTKFTHAYYIGMECIFLAIVSACYRRWDVLRLCTAAVLAGAAAGILIIGCNPYIINTLYYGSPVYPLGSGSVDIMTCNTPEIYEGCNRLTALIKMLLSVDGSPWALLNGRITPEGFMYCYVNVMKVNGFGILMTPAILVGLALLIASRPARPVWIGYAFVWLLALSFEQSWWARYICFLWAVIVLPLVASTLARRHGRTRRILALAMYVLVGVNALISLGGTIYSRLSYTLYVDYIFRTAKASGRPLEVYNMNAMFRQQFAERGVEFREVVLDVDPGDLEMDHWYEALPDPDHTFHFFNNFNTFVRLPIYEFPDAYGPTASLAARLARFEARRCANPNASE